MILSFAVHGTKALGQTASPKTFSSRMYYSQIKLPDEEFNDAVEIYRKQFDVHGLLTTDIVDQVKQLAGFNAALTCLCLETITRTFPEKNAKNEPQVKTLIANGTLDSYLVINRSCRVFRPREDIERCMHDWKVEPEIFISVLEKLVKTGRSTLESSNSGHALLIKLGICSTLSVDGGEIIEFTCHLTAVYYQKYFFILSTFQMLSVFFF